MHQPPRAWFAAVLVAAALWFGIEAPLLRATPANDVTTLDPVEITEDLITSFGLALNIYSNPDTGRVTIIAIRDLARSGSAAGPPLHAGDRILRADNLDVTKLPATFKRGSTLRRLFVNRQPGDRIKLEVRSAQDGSVHRVVLIH